MRILAMWGTATSEGNRENKKSKVPVLTKGKYPFKIKVMQPDYFEGQLS